MAANQRIVRPQMKLVGIDRDGSFSPEKGPLPEIARSVVESTQQLYSRVGWSTPWIGYLAFEDGECVGTCAFTAAPAGGVVEIAYFTFPGHEGRGVATRMGERLVSMAGASAPEILVTAHTLPQESASTRVLLKAGFVFMTAAVHPEDGQIWIWRHERGEKAPGRSPDEDRNA